MHYEVLSPLENPLAYAVWLLNLGASIISIVVSINFFRATRRRLWLVFATTFLLLPLFTAIPGLRQGIPALPHAEVSNPVEVPRSSLYDPTFSRTVTSRVYLNWEINNYLLAIALFFAWRQFRARQVSAGT